MRPPGLAVRLISRRLTPGTAEFVLGDLEEGFYARGRRRGARAARRWYWMQALRIALTLPALPRVPAGPAMPALLAFPGVVMHTLKHAVRMVVLRPLYAATVAGTLALAIGANAVIFGMVDMLLLRPLPIADPDRVGWFFGVDEARAFARGETPAADFLDYQELSSFTHVAALSRASYTMTGRGDARRLSAYAVTPGLFDVWKLNPTHGRRMLASDGVPGAAPVVLLTHNFWRNDFASDPAIVGQSLMLSGVAHTIVGVLGPELNYGNLASAHVWTPYIPERATASRTDRRLAVMGRLVPGVSLEQADAEVKTLAARIARENPDTHAGWSARVIPAREGMLGEDGWIIMTLLVVTVAMVLLIACANVTNILLAGTAARGRELAVRAALGAGRRHIVTQLLAEAAVLAVIGGALGLAVGWAAIKLLALVARGNFVFEALAVNYRTALFVLVLSLVAPVLFALVPALQSARLRTAGGLNALGTRVAGTRRARRFRSALVVAQIALAMTLLVVSSLALRSMVALMRVDLGFASSGIGVVRFEVPQWKYASDDDAWRAIEASVARLGSVASVTSVAAASGVPGLDPDILRALIVDGRPLGRGESRLAGQVIAGERFFETLGIPLVAGRGFDGRDRRDGQAAAVVSRVTAERYLGGVDAAIGRRVRFESETGLAGETRFATVVGVAADVANADVDQAPNPIVYLPFAQHPRHDAVLLVASAAPPLVTGSLRDAMRELDRDIAVDVETFDALIGREFAATRALVALFVAFGAVALALAASGLYGVIAFVAAQRTREFGVRVALGAGPFDVGRLMLVQGGALVASGLAVGLTGSIALAQLTRGLLYGVSASDPSTYAAVAAIVGATALCAAYVPARRAMRLNPIDALRAE